jgi:3-hydroxyisobutyrate dehydrogenase-like beta-hydroxyacid dehydrogenase
MDIKKQKIGIFGLGQMGGGIAKNLVKAGYGVTGYDPNKKAQEKFADVKGAVSGDYEKMIEESDIVLVCVEAKVSIAICGDI